MKINAKTIGIIILSAFLMSACGMLGGASNSLSVKTEQSDAQTFEIKDGKFSTMEGSRVNMKVTEHYVCLANYDMKLPAEPATYNFSKRVEDEEQTKFCFKLNGPNEFDADAQIETGEYPLASWNSGYKPKHIGLTPDIFLFEDGKAERISFNSRDTKGNIEITEASADKITGTVDLSDGKNEVKGGFTAERAK